jgi:hypothetical protein
MKNNEDGGSAFPVIMGRSVTRAEIIEGIRDCYREMCALKRRVEPDFVRYPDMDTVLDYIEEHGLPPKDSADALLESRKKGGV